MCNTVDEDLGRHDAEAGTYARSMLAHYGPHELFTAIAAVVGACVVIAWAATRRR
jgi:hypothetical protein